MQTFCKYFASKGRGKLVNFASVYGVLVPRFEIYKNTQMTTPVEYVAISRIIQSVNICQVFHSKQHRSIVLAPVVFLMVNQMILSPPIVLSAVIRHVATRNVERGTGDAVI